MSGSVLDFPNKSLETQNRAAAFAWQSYLVSGRGALVADIDNGDEQSFTCSYLAVDSPASACSLLDWKANPEFERGLRGVIDEYDPESEYVIIAFVDEQIKVIRKEWKGEPYLKPLDAYKAIGDQRDRASSESELNS